MKKTISALVLLITSYAHANELTLYFAHSPKGLDWSSPSDLVMSAASNKLTFQKRFIGHVFVEMKCNGTTELTGMTAKRFDYLNQLLIGGKGLGILFHSFEGQLENQNDIRPELNEYLKTGQVNFARFKLNEHQCKRISQYYQEFRDKKVDGLYGLANRPRSGEGAGCSAFGVSFVDVLGILDQDMKESWQQTINLPLEYSGAPVTENYVGLYKFFINDVKWASDDQPHRKLTFWDPDKMYQWVTKKIKEKQIGYEIISVEKSQGVVFDKSHFPVSEGPIWLQQLDPNNKNKTI